VRRVGSGEPVFVVHALLRAHLLARLAALDVGAPKRQHAMAARWLADEGRTARALDHAVAAGDRTLTTTLLRAWGARLLLTEGAQAIVDDLATVPADLWDPDLAGLAVLARAESGDLAGARAALVRADTLAAAQARTGGASLADGGSPSLLRVAQFHLRRLEGHADDPELPEEFGDVLAWRPDAAPSADALDRHLLLLLTRGQWAFAAGRYDDSWRDLQLALDLATMHRRDRIALQAMSTLAGVPALVGDAAGTDQYATDALSLIEGRGWATHPALANLYTAGAWAASLMLEPLRAEQMMGRAVEALRGNVDPEYAAYAGMVEAMLFAERAGDPAPAMALLARFAQGGAATQVTPGLRQVAAMSRVRIMLMRGDLPGAEAAIADFRRWFPGTADPFIARAQLKAAQGLWQDCRAALRTIDERALPVITPVYQVVLPLLESVAEERLGRRSSARDALLRSLAVAGPRGVVRPFWEAGPTMRRMLERQRGQFGIHEDFVATILLRWDAVEASAASKPVVADVDGVALTPRELEMLRALPSLSTAEELAVEQMVTVNTIRTHMRTLYRKLGVHTRRDAVRRGRDLGLL
jgi:LuxR family maltose regulon positive regulatory protein